MVLIVMFSQYMLYFYILLVVRKLELCKISLDALNSIFVALRRILFRVKEDEINSLKPLDENLECSGNDNNIVLYASRMIVNTKGTIARNFCIQRFRDHKRYFSQESDIQYIIFCTELYKIKARDHDAVVFKCIFVQLFHDLKIFTKREFIYTKVIETDDFDESEEYDEFSSSVFWEEDEMETPCHLLSLKSNTKRENIQKDDFLPADLFSRIFNPYETSRCSYKRIKSNMAVMKKLRVDDNSFKLIPISFVHTAIKFYIFYRYNILFMIFKSLFFIKRKSEKSYLLNYDDLFYRLFKAGYQMSLLRLVLLQIRKTLLVYKIKDFLAKTTTEVYSTEPIENRGISYDAVIRVMERISKITLKRYHLDQNFVYYISKVAEKIKKSKKNILSTLLNSNISDRETFRGTRFLFNSSKILDRICVFQTKVISSKNQPILFEFETTQQERVKFIFKNGDDLTNDMFFNSITELIYKILGFKINLYGVVPFNRESGVVEFIDSKKISEFKNSKQLKGALSTPKESYLDSFITSLAVSTLISYIFGIGDRTQENILVSRCGIYFNIDYSYILGDDPKILKPTIVIPKIIIDLLKEDDLLLISFIQRMKDYFLKIRANYGLIEEHSNQLFNSNIFAFSKEKFFYFLKKRISFDQNEEFALNKFNSDLKKSLNSLKTRIVHFINKVGSFYRKIKML